MNNIYKRWVITCQKGDISTLIKYLSEKIQKYKNNARIRSILAKFWDILKKVVNWLRKTVPYQTIASKIQKGTGFIYSFFGEDIYKKYFSELEEA